MDKTKTLSDFRPFRAWRYSSQVKPEDVIAPPYDVISGAYQDALYQRSPHNVIRLILGEIQESDTEKDNRYTRAALFYTEWKEKGILKQDEKPCLYLYAQTFQDPFTGQTKTRNSLLGLIKLEPFEKNVVIPHEKTLDKPKQDRLNLIQETKATFSPIFGLYDDPGMQIRTAYAPWFEKPADFEAKDDQGVEHKLWVIEEGKVTQQIHSLMNQRSIYIADGHHRYTTALNYAKLMREKEGVSVDQERPYDFTLMALVDFKDTGVVLGPTHRLIQSFEGLDLEVSFQRLSEFFETEACEVSQIQAKFDAADPKTACFGLYLGGGKCHFLKLKDAAKAKEKISLDKPEVWYDLDVNILAYLVFEKILNLPASQWEDTLQFSHKTEDAVKKVESGQVACAFLLKPPPVEILRDMGNVRELMPQKSTYFDPKLASGFVFYDHTRDGSH